MSSKDIQFIPDEIFDRNTGTSYKKARFFGKVCSCFFTPLEPQNYNIKL